MPANVDRNSTQISENDAAWRDELARRLEVHRGRRRKPVYHESQSQLPFEAPTFAVSRIGVATADLPFAGPAPPETLTRPKEEFSFTIAIGRPAQKHPDESRMVIDVSLPPELRVALPEERPLSWATEWQGLYATASIEERRLAALVDAACLFFAYGAFLALFNCVGKFTPGRLSSAVCLATFALVYLQYFALFTIFGGTTPGMMVRGLQVVSFTGEPPAPRQMLMRSAGYVLSAATCFLGFLWSVWDEDTLTWHDRISHTYLHEIEACADIPDVAHSR